MADVTTILDEMQQTYFDRAKAFRQTHSHKIDDRRAFDAYFTPENSDTPEIHGGFALSHWCGDAACEARIKDTLKVTIRAIPLDGPDEAGTCIYCEKPSVRRVVFAKAY